MLRVFHKSRQYPIVRDEYGRSARRQAFDLFDTGYRPAQVFKEDLVAVSMKTLFRYFEDWKKQRGKPSYSVIKRLMTGDPEVTEEYVRVLAEYFSVSKEEIVLRMQKPWGIKELSKGELPDRRLYRIQSEIEDRLEAALRLIYLAEQVFQNSPNEVKRLFWDIVTLGNNTRLVIQKTEGHVSIKKEKL